MEHAIPHYEPLPTAVFILQRETIAYANPLALELLGGVSEEVVGRVAYDFVHPLDRTRIQRRLERLLAGYEADKGAEIRIRTLQGDVRVVSARAKLVDAQGRMLAAVTDITPQRLKSYLRETERNIQHLFKNTTDIYYRIDAQGKVLMASPAVERILGFSCESVIGRDSSEFYADPMERDALVEALLRDGNVSDYEVTLRHKDGAPVHVSISSHALLDDDGNYLAVEGVMRDISERKRLETKLRELAVRDELTGILNRRAFLGKAEEALRRAHRHGRPLAFMILDIDWFKQINDRFGHLAGDYVLRRFADTVAGCLRDIDHFGRLGGEEFGLLLDRCEMQQAREVGERIRDAVSRLQLRYKASIITLTVSTGATLSEPGDECVETLIDRADKALYSAKREGRNRVVWNVAA